MTRRQIPPSCASLDLEAVYRELVRTGGNVSRTARTLGVPIIDLRRMTCATPELLDAALEAHAQALDEAESAIRQAMRQTRDRGKRLAAASFILKTSPAAKRRGF